MSDPAHSGHGTSGYEKKDVNVRIIGLWAAIIVVAIVISIVWVSQYTTYLKEQALYENQLKPPNPLLLELRAHESTVMSSYQLLDSAKRIYQIPVERAETLVVEQYKDNQYPPVSPNPTGRENPR